MVELNQENDDLKANVLDLQARLENSHKAVAEKG